MPSPFVERNNLILRFKLQAAGIREPVDPIIREKIVELSGQGVRKVSEMRRHLEAYVKTAGIGGHLALDKTRRRFHPTNKDIYNHMYQARVTHRFSKLDQENVDALIVKWKKETPADAFHFRPHSSDDAAVNDACNSFINDQDDIMSDEVPDPKPLSSDKNTLLFCHQTADQRELLKKYGDQMCLMDATYRTTKYGSFVIQYENTQSIEEALTVFKQWNPTSIFHG